MKPVRMMAYKTDMSVMQKMHPKRLKSIARYHSVDPTADSADQLKAVYADWAESYDDDNDNKLGTVSQPTTVVMLARNAPDLSISILDVGCGTGLVGYHLAKTGFATFDGCDPSSEMMQRARRRGYRDLRKLDPRKPLPFDEDSYDATLCVGVFTHQHLGPDGLDELLRVTKPGGLICFTVNEGVWGTAGFDKAIPALEADGHWLILEQQKRNYMVKEGVQGWYITARKT
ncbi:MAG: class I SAM-dependent DNA methyltransferase [Rhizobiaceae bacterium]